MGDKSHPIVQSVPFLFSATTAPVPISCRNQRGRPATSNAGGIKSTVTHLTLNILSPKLVSFHTFPQLLLMMPVYFTEEFFSLLPLRCQGFVSQFLLLVSKSNPKSLLSPFFLLSFLPPTSQQGCLLISSFAKIRNVVFLWPFWTIRILESLRWVAIISSFWAVNND